MCACVTGARSQLRPAHTVCALTIFWNRGIEIHRRDTYIAFHAFEKLYFRITDILLVVLLNAVYSSAAAFYCHPHLSHLIICPFICLLVVRTRTVLSRNTHPTSIAAWSIAIHSGLIRYWCFFFSELNYSKSVYFFVSTNIQNYIQILVLVVWYVSAIEL